MAGAGILRLAAKTLAEKLAKSQLKKKNQGIFSFVGFWVGLFFWGVCSFS